MKFLLGILLLLVSCEYQFNETEQEYFTDEDIEFYYETDNASYLLIQTDTILEQVKIQINNDNPKSQRFNRVIDYIEVS